MGILQYLADVVTGRLKHFNDIAQPVIGKLWANSGRLNRTAESIFRNFIVAAALVVEPLLLPHVRLRVIIPIKKIEINEFRQLYYVLLSYFAFLFYTLYPSMKEDVKDALFKVTSAPGVRPARLINEVLHSLEKLGEIDLADPEKHDMFRITSEVWHKVVKVVGYGNARDMAQLVFFGGVSVPACAEAIKEIKIELKGANLSLSGMDDADP